MPGLYAREPLLEIRRSIMCISMAVFDYSRETTRVSNGQRRFGSKLGLMRAGGARMIVPWKRARKEDTNRNK
jgi:hypothetical protein